MSSHKSGIVKSLKPPSSPVPSPGWRNGIVILEQGTLFVDEHKR